MKVSVLGIGNGGQAIAGWLAMQGHSVSLYGRNEQIIAELYARKCIELTGAIKGEGTIEEITSDIERSVSGADLIMVVTTANAHSSIAQQIARSLQNGQVILLNPGRTGGALEFKRALDAAGCKARVYVAEAQTLV